MPTRFHGNAHIKTINAKAMNNAQAQPERFQISEIFDTANDWQTLLVFESFLSRPLMVQYLKFNYPKNDLKERTDGLLYAFRVKHLKNQPEPRGTLAPTEKNTHAGRIFQPF